MIPLKISESELIELAEIVMVANTPFFLFDRMRSSNAVIAISLNHTSSELGYALEQCLQRAKEHEEAAVAAYAVIVALSRRGDAEAMEILSSVVAEEIRWGSTLIEYALKEHRPTNYVSVEASSALKPEKATKPEISVYAG